MWDIAEREERFLSDGFGVVAGEQPCLASQLAFPPGLIGALQDLDDIAGLELQLVRLFRVETVERSDLQRRAGFVLRTEEEEENRLCFKLEELIIMIKITKFKKKINSEFLICCFLVAKLVIYLILSVARLNGALV